MKTEFTDTKVIQALHDEKALFMEEKYNKGGMRVGALWRPSEMEWYKISLRAFKKLINDKKD